MKIINNANKKMLIASLAGLLASATHIMPESDDSPKTKRFVLDEKTTAFLRQDSSTSGDYSTLFVCGEFYNVACSYFSVHQTNVALDITSRYCKPKKDPVAFTPPPDQRSLKAICDYAYSKIKPSQ